MTNPSLVRTARTGLWHLRKGGLSALIEWERREGHLTTARTGIWHFRHGGLQALVKWQQRRSQPVPEPTRTVQAAIEPPSKNSSDTPTVGKTVEHQEPKKQPLLHTIDFDPYKPRDLGPRRPDITAAVILDDFSAGAFSHEWNIIRLRKKDWVSQIKGKKIDLLFVESAWHGNGDDWATLIGKRKNVSDQLRDVVVWCRAAGIPTVFWNKEDPPHYLDFIGSAGLFDLVLTTDSERIPAYKKDLGHDSVMVMPFAAQTEIHTPARNGLERDVRDVAFGGMYFAHKFKSRREQMDLLLGGAIDAEKRTGTRLEIFSRYLGQMERYQFPGELGERVVGSLSYDSMLRAYRAYKVFLNVNTVTDSPTMCARRLFEITACGTSVVTTPSASVRRYFAEDEILVADSQKRAENHLRSLLQSPQLRDRMVHRAQRRIWDEHTYTHRAESILARVAPLKHRKVEVPSVSVLAPTIRPQQLKHIVSNVARQEDVDAQLVLLTHGFDPEQFELQHLRETSGLNIVHESISRHWSLGTMLNRGVELSDGTVLSKMDDDDFYAPQYLRDLLRALFHSRAEVVGKAAHYMHLAGPDTVLLRQPDLEHKFVDGVVGPTLTARRETFLAHPFGDRTRGEDSQFVKDVCASGGKVYAADRFNFCQMRGRDDHTWAVHDQAFLATGRVETFGEPFAHVTV
ncbi:glycosyltransferase family protein [Kocuria atrinae]|uniref:glycosyltransferase family protein n=1 Tax=Kocuria atrinae TaxID=592377 RepID=UPI0031DA9BF4